MAQFVNVNINIGGKAIRQYSSVALSQDVFEHHEFRIVCPAEAIDGTSGSVFNKSKDFIGAKLTIEIDAVGSDGKLQFSGVVTQIESSRYSGHAGDIIISGFSPTVLLDNGAHCKTWEKKAVKNIAQDVLNYFPQNMLPSKVAPANGETLSYTVQYKETGWQFLSRLSATHGEWFFYDGQKLVLGAPQGNKTKLTYGSNLSQFNMAMQMVPLNFKMTAYDYMNHQVYNGIPAGIDSKAGLNDLGKHAFQKSQQFYSAQPKQWYNNFLTNKRQLDDMVNTKAAMQSSNMIRFNGSSGQPGVQVGGTISVQGKNVFSQSDESFGDYTVITVNHYCDGQGNYNNEFVAIPSSIKMPPVSVHTEPHCETQSAMVTDNNDPNGLGRIRVKFHWMGDAEKSPWLRVTSPHGGDGKGMFFIPETGEEVIVGFEGDSPTKPYIIGTVYHGKAKTSFGNSGNDVKALQTRSGNLIVLNDQEGSIHVADSKGNDVKIDGKGNINVTSSESIVLTCGSAKLEMKKDGTINITGKNKITIDGTSGPVNIQSNNTIDVNGTNGTTVKSTTKVDVGAPMVEVKADGSLKMGGPIVQVSGDTVTNISGGILNLNS